MADTAAWTVAKITAIRDLMLRTAEAMKARVPKIYSRELVETIFVEPYCRIADLVEAGIAQRQAASVYLRALAEAGLLEQVKVGREKLFINRALLMLLAGA